VWALRARNTITLHNYSGFHFAYGKMKTQNS
jgi:hypothetical protein